MEDARTTASGASPMGASTFVREVFREVSGENICDAASSTLSQCDFVTPPFTQPYSAPLVASAAVDPCSFIPSEVRVTGTPRLNSGVLPGIDRSNDECFLPAGMPTCTLTNTVPSSVFEHATTASVWTTASSTLRANPISVRSNPVLLPRSHQNVTFSGCVPSLFRSSAGVDPIYDYPATSEYSLPNPGMATRSASTAVGMATLSGQTQSHMSQGPQSVNRFNERRFTEFKPQPYDGKVNWNDYHRQFEIIATRNQWTDGEKADVLAAQLQGEALLVLGTFPYNCRIEYHCLCQALEQRFGSDPSTFLTRFRMCTQRPRESISEYALSLQRLASGVFSQCPGDAVEQLIIAQFLEGLRDSQVQLMVRLSRPATLRHAIQAALEVDTHLDRTRGRNTYMVSSRSDDGNQNRTVRRRRRRHPSTGQEPVSQLPSENGIPSALASRR